MNDLTGLIAERIFVCPSKVFSHFVTKEAGKHIAVSNPCGNLLRLIFVEHRSMFDGKFFMVHAEELPDTVSEHYSHSRNGVAIHYVYTRVIGTAGRKPVFSYGPIRADHIKFVHCKKCLTRHGWKKFKKAVS